MREAGAPLLNDAPQAGRAGSRVSFLHPKWGQGTLIELVEHGHGTQKHVLEQPDLRAGGIH